MFAVSPPVTVTELLSLPSSGMLALPLWASARFVLGSDLARRGTVGWPSLPSDLVLSVT